MDKELATCTSKVQYRNKASALSAAARLAGKFNTSTLRVYRCAKCRKFHLTSRL